MIDAEGEGSAFSSNNGLDIIHHMIRKSSTVSAVATNVIVDNVVEDEEEDWRKELLQPYD